MDTHEYTITVKPHEDDITAKGAATGLYHDEFPETDYVIVSISAKPGDKPATWIVTVVGDKR